MLRKSKSWCFSGTEGSRNSAVPGWLTNTSTVIFAIFEDRLNSFHLPTTDKRRRGCENVLHTAS